tara:strand:+ start:1330 stop:1707 length:378 start_codon:yes stop_codon:yes gene_type:complete
MDKETAKLIRKLINENLNLENTGFKFELMNATYDDNQITFKLQVQSENAIPQSEAELDRDNKWRTSLGKKALSKETIATISGAKCKLVGFRPKARKQPYIVENVNNGKQYVIDERTAETYYAMAS